MNEADRTPLPATSAAPPRAAANSMAKLKSAAIRHTLRALLIPPLVWRRKTQARRALPSIFILGAPKCGTTSLTQHLGKHPNYLPAFVNELMFLQELPDFQSTAEMFGLAGFWGSWNREGLAGYRKFFPTAAKMERVRERTGHAAVSGDHTPFYLYCPAAVQRIREACAEPKLIILLREPIARAYSDYSMNVRWQLGEARSFEQAIDDELQGVTRNFRHRYLYQSVYAPHVRRWLAEFPGQVLVVDSRELFKSAAQCVERVLSFAGLPPAKLHNFKAANQGVYQQPLAAETRQRLAAYFAPHNEQLYDLLGTDFGWPRGQEEDAAQPA